MAIPTAPSRRAPTSSTGRNIRRASIGIAGRSPSTSTTTTSRTPRQPDRGRRQHAQHPHHAEHAHQPSVARVLQPAGARRAGVLDPQHRLQPARRFDATDQRLGGRAFLQQHDPVGNDRQSAELALAEQPDARARTRSIVHGDAIPTLFGITTYTNYTSSDYNGFGPMPGAQVNFRWCRPPFDVLADFPGPGKRPASRRASSRRWPSTARPRARTATASCSTTRSS